MSKLTDEQLIDLYVGGALHVDGLRAVADAAVQAEREKLPHVSYDKNADVCYVTFQDKPATQSEVVDMEVLARKDDDGRLVGLTIMDCSDAAVQAEREGQEPVGWYTEDYDTEKSATTYDADVRDRWIAKGWPVFPLYTTPPAAPLVPEGYVLVPVEPTEAMIDAAIDNGAEGDENIREYIRSDYKAMLAAAKAPKC